MPNKYSSTFLGIFVCPHCGTFSAHNVVPERATISSVFILTGVPVTHIKKYVVCSHCGLKSKMKGEFKDKYEQALRNHFDDEFVVKQFINDVEEICIENEVVSNGMIDERNLEIAVDKVYEKHAFHQGYNREFYHSLCQVYALNADYKFTEFNLMFRTKT